MQHIDPATLHFLRHRRSHPPKLLSNPPPARTELMKLLELLDMVMRFGTLVEFLMRLKLQINSLIYIVG